MRYDAKEMAFEIPWVTGRDVKGGLNPKGRLKRAEGCKNKPSDVGKGRN